MLRSFKVALAALAAVSMLALPAWSQDWPTRTLRIIVGFGAGGGTDIAARIVAQSLQEILGQAVIVENRVGNGGITGADAVAKSPKDGYTLLMLSAAHGVSAAVNKQLPYDPVKDFQMLSFVGTAGLVMVTHPNFPASDLKGVIDVLKADPGKFNYGSPGVGSTQQFAAELFGQMAGFKVTHIPYRSTPQVITGLLGGEIQYAFELIQPVVGQIESKALKAIAVTSPGRYPSVPNIPTFAETGLPGYDVTSWYGLALPAGTPQPIVDKLHNALITTLSRDEVRKQILTAGAQYKSSTAEELSAHVTAEIEKWRGVMVKAGIPQQ